MPRVITAGIFFLWASVAAAQLPDSRDSMIFESKTVYPQSGPAAGESVMRVRVSITNKDTLLAWTIAIVESTLVGNAYATLGRSNNGTGGRNFNSCITHLPHPSDGRIKMGASAPFSVVSYHSTSPDTFSTGSFSPAGEDTTKEPPNSTRRALFEIKFDSVRGLGQFVLDSTRVLANRCRFTRVPSGQGVEVNFVRGIITVHSPKGDVDLDGELTASDVIASMNNYFLGIPPPAGASFCDIDCDGPSVSDIVLLMLLVFLGYNQPC